ncbi:MAG: diguanylate cyclase [Candidatus Acidiferrales bacterium]
MSEFADPEIFRAVLESLPTGVYFVGSDKKIAFWNDGAERITGYLRQDVVGRLSRENIVTRRDAPAAATTNATPPEGRNPLEGALLDGKFSESEAFLRHKDGHHVPVRLRTVPVRNGAGKIIGVAESFDESIAASEWDRRQNKLAEYGCIDEATGVLTHAFVQSHLRDSLATFAEHRMPFGIFCVQIDKLNEMKAKYGPGAAVDVLRVVAGTLENSLRPNDFLGRWGDNEFLAILTECSSAEIGKVGERLRKTMGYSEIHWWGDQLSVTVSMGGTTAKPADTPESMLERAEKSLADSLTRGGDCVTVFGEASR